MSKRHQSSRRRSYGRRQHELHERSGDGVTSRSHRSLELRRAAPRRPSDPFAFMDPRTPRLRYVLGE